MSRMHWLQSACAFALTTAALPALAQDVPAAPSPAEEAVPVSTDQGDIIVTATRRSQALSDVPLAISAVTSETLQNSGASDLRQLNQVSPSLLVTSTQSEAGASTARIRGIGTVGDNAGLESSVAVFVDGVYRSRSATALTELGAIDRIEVLRGPQGTLFGRNASAGLIHVITARPKYEEEGTAEFSYGNYDYWRGVLGFTGPISDTIAYRLDGVYVKRDGFIKEDNFPGATGRDFNDRDRWLVRGQLLFEPTDQLSVRIIGDYADRDEQCCAATYLPVRTILPGSQPGTVTTITANPVASAIRGLGGVINDDTFARRLSVTPGRDYRQDVRDWGLSGEIAYEMGFGTLTSITAYRDNRYIRGQDADFTNLDILYRPNDGTDSVRFRTFTQELRLQGEALDGRLDWLVGGYYANEKLDMRSRLSYGADFDRFVNAIVRTNLPTFPGYNFLPEAASGLLQQGGVPAGSANAIAANIVRPGLAANTGTDDRFRQNSRNFAFFTHNVFEVTDTVSFTIGARYTNERKRLNADFVSNTPPIGQSLATSIAQLTAFAAANPALATPTNQIIGLLRGTGGNTTGLAQIPGALFSVLSPFNGSISDTRKESEWTGTAVLSWKPVPNVLTYASYSKGYKAGGFNLDRSVLNLANPSGADLQFDAEKVDAYEIGLKWNGPGIDINVAGFIQDFKNFQLNNFQGVNFIVENINGCSELAGGSGADEDVGVSGSANDAAANATGACTGSVQPGLRSKGVELEVFLRPSPTVSLNVGATIAESRYKDDLVGKNGRPLPSSLFQLPGRRLSNSAQYTFTGSAGWTPPIGGGGITGLLYADFRYQSELNTGSDLNIEKDQAGVMLVNARVGLAGPDKAWAIEFWAQNVFDTDYTQIAFNAPLQGSGETRAVASGQQPNASRLYTTFLGEPRTYGVTVRTKF